MTMTFTSQTEARAALKAMKLVHDPITFAAGTYYIRGTRKNGVDTYTLTQTVNGPAKVAKVRDIVPGATRKMSITDRAVYLLIKGNTREQVIAELIENGATKESARCTAHFVFTGKVSKAHADMIANKKWVGFSAR